MVEKVQIDQIGLTAEDGIIFIYLGAVSKVWLTRAENLDRP
jgi:hypothetical protein